MKIPISLFLLLITILLITLNSCERDPYLKNNPITAQDMSYDAGDTTYNIAYDDSILFCSDDLKLHISDINGEGNHILFDNFYINNAVWSSNKRNIVFIGMPVYQNTGNGVYLVNLNTNKINRLAITDTSVKEIAISPNRKYIAFTIKETKGYKVKLFNIEVNTSEAITDWFIDPSANNLSWSPDSKEILLGDGYLLNIMTHEMNELFSFSGQIFQSNWSPDGTRVAFSGTTQEGWYNIYIINLISGAINLLYPQNKFQYTVTWSKNSRQLIFDQRSGGAGAKSYLCRVNIDGTAFSILTDSSQSFYNPSWYK